MMLKKKMYAMAVIIAIGIVLAIYGAGKHAVLVEGLGFLLIVAGLIANIALIRCPYCGNHLGRYFVPGQHCPGCGQKVE